MPINIKFIFVAIDNENKIQELIENIWGIDYEELMGF